MHSYIPPLEDIRFNLEVFGYDALMAQIPKLAEFDLETAMALLGEYANFCAGTLYPLNAKADRQGLRFDGATGKVTTPDGFKEAYAGWVQAGFGGMAHSADHGGGGAPFTLAVLGSEILIASNKSFSMCPGLTTGLIDALEAHGTEEQKERFLHKLITGEWSGTMCLTEPQCGTDLGLIRTTAVPEGDAFRLTGTKIWITFGDHDLTDNIVHLVLARLPGAPPGIKGISAFLVPKFLEDGSFNNIACGGLEHKMGIHASPTCVMNIDGAKGWILGEPNKGMRSMFVMMNAARLNVGIEGVALAEASYQAALTFAKDRRQSRALNPARSERGQEADNILVHPDVRRMLLNIKATNEPLRGLVAMIALAYDRMLHHPDPEERAAAEDRVALMTPIIKSFGSERGFLNVSEAMQVMGGAGFTTDWPVEQNLRDVRIAMIYEGTNHIQALDLVGRKLPMGGGRLLQSFAADVTANIEACASIEALRGFADALGKEAGRLTNTTMQLMGKAMEDAEEAGAGASNYLNQFALVTLGHIWLLQLRHLLEQEDSAFKRGKFQTARYYFEMVLPEAALYARRVAVGKGPMMDADIDLF